MIRFSELLGHDAVELGTAITVGKVTGIVLERDRIVSVELSAGDVPSTGVHGFDGDVVTFDPLLAVGSPKSVNEVIEVNLRRQADEGRSIGEPDFRARSKRRLAPDQSATERNAFALSL
jgi:hypothetical protein